MTTKKKTSPALIATAIYVIATIDTRCRAGYVFTNEKERRIELVELTPEQIAAIEKDPYLKVTYEADEDNLGSGKNTEQLAAAEAQILELETQLTEATKQVAQLTSDLAAKDKELTGLIEQLETKDAELQALSAEIATLKETNEDKATTKKK